jgi:hypothetical protein
MNKYLVTPIKQRFLSLWVTENQVEEWAKKWDFFFILGMGRSGTTFLASFLNRAKGAYVFHEPAFEDFNAHVKAFYSPEAAEKYIQKFRKKEIYLRMHHINAGIYGEVNSSLRRHAGAIKNAFPRATVLHLVRDGRDVVRSLMSRRMMTPKDPFSIRIHPTKSDAWSERWRAMDRFSRICWYWQVENSYLRATIPKMVQFEKILSNYEYFRNEILELCHIHVEKTDWENAVVSPRNTTSRFGMPRWDKWTPDQKKIFTNICGDEMAKCGYEF